MQKQLTFPLIWDADTGAPEKRDDPDRATPLDDQVRCLWRSGRWTNRAEVARRHGVPESLDDGASLAALHLKLGLGLAGHVHGCLSWIVWDGRRRELVLVGDRMGLGGLYWRRRGARVEVADRVASLLPPSPCAERLCLLALASHLRGGAPASGRTFFDDVEAVSPGGLVVFSPGRVERHSYWSPALGPRMGLDDDRACADRLWRLLVRVAGEYGRERAAIALSGGLDSTILAAALKESGTSPEMAAWIGVSPEVPESDESERASSVARHLRLAANEIRADDQPPLGRGIRTRRDSPHFFYYTDWWETLLETAANGGTETLFTGGGGDHLFGGVSGYPDLLLTGRWRRLGRELKEHARWAPGGLSFLLRRRLLGPLLYAYLPWWRRRCLPAPPWLGGRLREAYREACQRTEKPVAALPGRVHRLRCIDLPRISQFCQDMNRRADAQGVQLSHPLLDHRLVDFASSLPAWRTARAGWDKWILRQAAQGRLPSEVTATRAKVVPGAILRGAVAARRAELLSGVSASMAAAEAGWIEPEPLRQAIDRYAAGESDDSTFWFALTLEDWLSRHF